MRMNSGATVNIVEQYTIKTRAGIPKPCNFIRICEVVFAKY